MLRVDVVTHNQLDQFIPVASIQILRVAKFQTLCQISLHMSYSHLRADGSFGSLQFGAQELQQM